MKTILQNVLEAAKTANITFVRFHNPRREGEYDTETKRIRISVHSERPYEKVLIHELLHHLYPTKTERWVRRWERTLWQRLSRRNLAVLTKAIREFHG